MAAVGRQVLLVLRNMTSIVPMQDEAMHGAYSVLDSSAWVLRNSSPASRTMAASHTVFAPSQDTNDKGQGGGRRVAVSSVKALAGGGTSYLDSCSGPTLIWVPVFSVPRCPFGCCMVSGEWTYPCPSHAPLARPKSSKRLAALNCQRFGHLPGWSLGAETIDILPGFSIDPALYKAPAAPLHPPVLYTLYVRALDAGLPLPR